MGVNQLWALLSELGEDQKVKDMKIRSVAVDANLILFKAIKAMRDAQGQLVHNAHLRAAFAKVLVLREHRINPVFVFDGASHTLKQNVLDKRRSTREKNERNYITAVERLQCQPNSEPPLPTPAMSPVVASQKVQNVSRTEDLSIEQTLAASMGISVESFFALPIDEQDTLAAEYAEQMHNCLSRTNHSYTPQRHSAEALPSHSLPIVIDLELEVSRTHSENRRAVQSPATAASHWIGSQSQPNDVHKHDDDEVFQPSQQQIEEIKKLARNAETLTADMVDDCIELLGLLGIPCLVSDGEAEATCAALNCEGYVDAVITDDADAFLFGAKVVYRTGSKANVMQKYTMERIQQNLGLDREKLVLFAMLLGSDFTEGVGGVGMVRALEVIAEERYSSLLGLTRFKTDELAKKKKSKMRFPNDFPSSAVYHAYVNSAPPSTKPVWSPIDVPRLLQFASAKGFMSKDRILERLQPILAPREAKPTQAKIDSFFRTRVSSSQATAPELQLAIVSKSKRMRSVVTKIRQNAVTAEAKATLPSVELLSTTSSSTASVSVIVIDDDSDQEDKGTASVGAASSPNRKTRKTEATATVRTNKSKRLRLRYDAISNGSAAVNVDVESSRDSTASQNTYQPSSAEPQLLRPTKLASLWSDEAERRK
eukprot:GILK01009630.1.p1 GENE.GILK01009630.1~~GILK01009630.1.p1  ORF type:complete len:654 (-),score=98.85 GILK01009630.1:305-2266(-)